MKTKVTKTLFFALFATVLQVSVVFGGITIDYFATGILEKDENNIIGLGYADAGLSVYFVADATCNCGCEDLIYKWYFGDGTSADGKNVSHIYSGGTHAPQLCVKCNGCSDHHHSDFFGVRAIDDVEIYQIGEQDGQNRLSFNTHTTCYAKTMPDCDLPPGADDLIDWSLYIDAKEVEKANDESVYMNLPSADWPTSNSGWGSGKTLYCVIDSTCVEGQDDELITGSASIIGTMETLSAYYYATGTENPTSDKNWFYYYKDNEGSGDPYTYNDTAQSSAGAGGGMSSVKIANEVYNGQEYITYDHSNPGGLLKSGAFSATTYKYYACFLGVLAHESEHAINATSGGAGDGDTDGDYLRTAYENSTALTNPNDEHSARGTPANHPDISSAGFHDAECYAGGPVEKGGLDGASTSNDWAHPGTNWE